MWRELAFLIRTSSDAISVALLAELPLLVCFSVNDWLVGADIENEIGDIDRCTVYVSLAPGMDHPAGVYPPVDNAARCLEYTSSDEDQSRPASTTDDRVAGKRPMAVEPSSTEAIPAGTAADPSMGQGSTSHAPKRRWLVRIVDDDNKEDETTPSLVRRPRSRPNVAPIDVDRVIRDPPAAHVEPIRPGGTEAAATATRTRRSVASDVDPGNTAGLRTTESAVADDNAAAQTVREQSAEQTAVAATTEVAEEEPAQDEARTSTLARGNETAGMPLPSNVAEEGDRIPTPLPAEEERGPTPAPAQASTPEGSPSQGKGPMIPVAVAGGSTEGEEARTASDDEVEEIQGCPHDGHQHIYVWHQHGDH
ncbi:skin secretory protein xP2-like [Sorghum bicolor]|uniref:skin secretory protein xP2-like n=1 Tax=Sorghum bicolor TaxID=4558 RepID=UPI000B426D3B|nr:skin secretory protein xP2-like [Sorghum bicolor]|eukprot:XP_021306286.1 skin secretory protein xP2-like [Sorghum bicolor]